MLRALQTSWMIVPPIIAVPGIIGSILTVLTVTSRFCKKSSFTAYLGALSVTDALTVTLSTLEFFGLGIDAMAQHEIICKMQTFLSYLLPTLSSCLVATLSVDRMLVTCFPMRMRKHTQKMACIVIGSILGFLLLINAHEFYGFTLVETENITRCVFVDTHYELFYNYYFSWVYFAVYWFLPVVLIIGCNIAMVVKIRRSTSQLRSNINARLRSRQLVRVAIVVSTAFVLLVSPSTIYSILRPFIFEGSGVYYTENETDYLIYTVVLYINLLNFSCNFFLYFLSGARFRQDLKSALCRKKDL